MARPANEGTVRLSVLDRLSEQFAGEPESWEASVDLLKQSILRDVEWLLNTRRGLEPVPDQYPELQASVFRYGLADVSSMSRDSDTINIHLVRYLEEALRTFEPRLMSIRVTPSETEGRAVRFTVEAMLRMDPNPERVVFDTVLEPTRGEFQVAEDSGA